MKMVDKLADSLNTVFVSETKGRGNALVKPASKMMRKVLDIFRDEGYIDSYEAIDDGRGGKISIKLKGRVNACKAIKPRFSVKAVEWEKWESRYLPARGIGVLVVSTSRGLMTHLKARELKIGGRLIAFVY